MYRAATKYAVEITELESFAHRMLKRGKEFAVCTYEFELIYD